MEGADGTRQEPKEQSLPCGGTSPARGLTLSSFQFPKEKKCRSLQAKVFNKQQAFRAISSKVLLPFTKSASEWRDYESRSPDSCANPSPGMPTSNLSCWQALSSIIQRQANILKEDSSNAKRQKSLSALKDIFIQSALPRAFYGKAFPFLLEPFLLCLSDPTEAARYSAADLLSKFLSEVLEVDGALGNVLEALVSRFGSQDIEGVAHLPVIMRPDPEYKPLQLTPVEKSEDVRQLLLQVLRIVLDRCSDECVWNHLDLVTGLLRAGAMDACPEIKTAAMCMLVEFCDRHQRMLLHFTEPLTRSLLSCLVHQKAKVRIRALWALTHVLACGFYKYNGEIIQMLAGWRDPNLVPIKSLYETTTIRNYFAELLADHSPMVRMFFFDTLAHWLLYFKDKADYEAWLFPYLLSGLFDSYRPIQQLVFYLLERLGKHYEDTHEKELREIKQLGAPEPWSYQGKIVITFPLGGCWQAADKAYINQEKEQFVSFVSSYCERLHSLGFLGCSLTEKEKDKFLAEGGALVNDPTRPNLGTRTMVKTYFRRYAKTLFEPIEDFKEVTMVTSARLLVVSLAYIEDSFVEWLDSCLRVCASVLSSSQNHSAAAVETYRVIMRLVGIYIDPQNYWGLVKDSLEESSAEEAHHRVAMLSLLALMLEGSFKALSQTFDASIGLGRLSSVVPEIAEVLSTSDLLQEQCVTFAAETLFKVVEVLVSGTLQQKATFPARTSRHLLSVICSIARSGNAMDDSESIELEPHVHELLGKLAMCQDTRSEEPAAAALGAKHLCNGLLMALPPPNLAALTVALRYSPPYRLIEEETYKVVLTKLEEFSAATQRAATRRGARRTALRLVRRLMLLEPADCIPVHAATETCVPETMKDAPFAASEASKKWAGCKDQAYPVNNTVMCAEPLKRPAEAAAEILSRIIISGCKKTDRLEDLEDTLTALKEFLTLPQPTEAAMRQATQDTLVMSGMVEDLCSLLREPCLHTKLFCAACESYAHDCAATYVGKSPLEIIEDMPLGKRRELRLSATTTAAALKHEAALLLRIILKRVAKDHNSLAHITSSAIAALHPVNKVQKQSGGALLRSAGGESDSTEANQPSMEAQGEPEEVRSTSNMEPTTTVEATNALVQCHASLPFQAQSPWLLFQVAGCLVDAVQRVAAGSNGPISEGDVTHGSKEYQCDWSLPQLTMPVAWKLPEYSYVELKAAQEGLLGLASVSDLCQAVDSCVRHIVELQSGVSGEYHVLAEDLEKGLADRPRANCSARDFVDMARNQLKSVPLARQQEQARLALVHFVRLVRTICPEAVRDCLRQYEASGRFSRRETLSRIC